jgi:ATP-dependent Lon protease
MGSSKSKSKIVPLVPLSRHQVVLPGVTVRVPIAGRADIAALLAHIYSKATTAKTDPVMVGCVPIKSPYLNGEGQKLLEHLASEAQERADPYAQDPAQATAKDLFTFGTLAKVTGVQGRRQGEIAITVEGLSRFCIEDIKKERPYFEASVLPYEEEGMLDALADFVFASLTI